MALPGSLQIDGTNIAQGTPVHFGYTVSADKVSTKNWVGIWPASGGAPVDGTKVDAATIYVYAPGSGGTVSVPSGTLRQGDYVAYFLYDDGYTSLATPVMFTVSILPQLPAPRFLGDFGRSGRVRLDAPAGLHVDAAGQFWVADTGSRDIRVFSPRGAGVGVIGAGVLHEPQDVVVSGDRVFVADTERDAVSVFTLRGKHLGEIGSGELLRPRGVAMAAPGSLLVSDAGNNRVAAFDVKTGKLSSSITSDTHIPFGLCVAGERTWVVSTDRQYGHECGVTAYVGGTSTITLGYGQHSTFGALSNPAHVAVDQAGHVLVSDPDFGFVSRFLDTGPFVGEFGTQGPGLLRYPHGVAVGRSGDIFVADTGNGRIARFGGHK